MMSWRRGAAVPALIPALAAAGTLALAACGAAASSGTATVAPAAARTSAPSGAATPSSAATASTPAASSVPHQTESNPPGDIPDQQVFIVYTAPGTHFSVKVPEGWARSTTAQGVRFTDKLNSITLQEAPAAAASTVASATSTVVSQLAGLVPAFAAGKVSTVSRAAGPAVLVTYLGDSAPDPVTNKVVRDAFERYAFWRGGHEAVLTLSGPQGADNVDPWKIVTDSLRWQ
jgi:hypothetical protein